MPSWVTDTGCSVTGSATGAGSSQWVMTTSTEVRLSTTWPGAEGTGTGRSPSKRMVPSTDGRSSWGRAVSIAWPTATGLPLLIGGTSRSPNREVRRVTGFSGCSPAWAIVASTSRSSPAARGSSVVVAAPGPVPATRVIGRATRGPSSVRSASEAAARFIPPISTPATVTPRGTLVAETSRSPT